MNREEGINFVAYLSTGADFWTLSARDLSNQLLLYSLEEKQAEENNES